MRLAPAFGIRPPKEQAIGYFVPNRPYYAPLERHFLPGLWEVLVGSYTKHQLPILNLLVPACQPDLAGLK
jgi:hypothetical protein